MQGETEESRIAARVGTHAAVAADASAVPAQADQDARSAEARNGHAAAGVAPEPAPPVERGRGPRFARPFRAPRADHLLRDIIEGQRPPAALQRDTLMRRALAVADVGAAALALGAAIAVGDRSPRPAALLALLLVVLFGKLARVYERDEYVLHKTTLDQAPALFHIATLSTLITWLASDAFVSGGFDKREAALMWVVLIVGLIGLRFLIRSEIVRATDPERVLVLGDGFSTERLRRRIETAHSLRAMVVGRVALRGRDRDEPRPLGPVEDLDYILRANGIERVIIAPDETPSDDMLDTIRVVKALGVKVSVLPRLFEVVGSSLEFDDVDGITVLGLRRYGLPRTSWYMKRSFDVVVSLAALFLLAPLLAAIALAVRLSSAGPVLFRQPRVGRRGARFEMYKFRTMYDGADREKANLAALNRASGLFKIPDDPRVTPVGRLLRRTSLDEVPQLFNVLRGEMSLVGPRPLVEEEDRKIAGWHHRRREGTPGMTGVWQVLGPTRISLDDMVKLDYIYRANWSLWLDMKILLRTVGHVLSQRGL